VRQGAEIQRPWGATMAIAIQSEHRELASTTRAFLRDHSARAANRALLEAPHESLPAFWKEFAKLGLLGLHLHEAYGGGGGGLAELVVVVEELGRAAAPGAAVPTMIASAVLAAAGSSEQQARLLPDLASGAKPAAVGLDGSVRLEGGRADGEAGIVLGAGLAEILVLAAGDDLFVVPASAAGLSIEVPHNLDPSRRSARVRLKGVSVGPEDVLPGARPHATAIARTLIAAEATGGALECVEMASGYAKIRD